jgi:hypothetical protein
MSQTHFSGPLASGDKQPGTPGGSNVGLAVLAQAQMLNANAALPVSAVFLLPPNSQIVDILVDTLVAFNGTAAPLTVGTPGAPPAYITTIDAKVVGRAAPVFSAGQLLSMANIGANTQVVVTVTPTGANTLGSVRTTLLYVQTA